MSTDHAHHLPMSRHQALSWNPAWSAADIRRLEENFDRVGAATYYRTRSDSFVTAEDADGHSLLTLFPGYVTFRRGHAPEDRPDPDWDGITLSTFRDRSAASRTGETAPAICPDCFLVLPSTGVCEYCS